MDEIKHKFLDLINKHQSRNLKIPAMGFSDSFIKTVSTPNSFSTTQPAVHPSSANKPSEKCCFEDLIEKESSSLVPDEEILASTESIYFEDGANTGVYVLNKFSDTELDDESIQRSMQALKHQQKVISKKVLQHILEQRKPCNDEIECINESGNLLQDSLLQCKKARSYLSCARKYLTTTNLQILATYKKREVLRDLLESLYKLRKLKSMEIQLQKLLNTENYPGAISLLLDCKELAASNSQYKCVDALSQKLQDTLLLVELQLDNVLNEMTQRFDVKKYSKLQEANKLLGKTIIATDQLHMNFISSMHTTAFTVLKQHIDQTSEEKQKLIFKSLCESIPADKYIPCLIDLCKSFWSILVCYYQATMWHQYIAQSENNDRYIESKHHSYIQQKFKTGHTRIWNDIQSKICTYLSNSRNLHQLKYEQFIQVLSIVQRLRKVGMEFCNEPSTNLMDCMKSQSIQFFQRYHGDCLEEICLFLDNEAWVPVNSFTSLIQLQEFNSVKSSLQRYATVDKAKAAVVIPDSEDPLGAIRKNSVASTSTVGSMHPQNTSSPKKQPERKVSIENMMSMQANDTTSNNSQEDADSSVYGSCGYFLRFSEKSSPFDGGFDESMLEEDILAGIADESSCYFSEESEEDSGPYNSAEVNDHSSENTLPQNPANIEPVIVSNASINVLRCIGRYLQMCKLLHSISPQIVASMAELVDFYTFVIHHFFGNDLPISSENLYSAPLTNNLARISTAIVPKVKNWPPAFSMIQSELSSPNTMYGLMQRVVGVESAITIVQQFTQLRGYLDHLLLPNDRKPLSDFLSETTGYITDLRKPIYMCVTTRVFDLPNILNLMGKAKWDINHVNIEHSSYVNVLNKGLQIFSAHMDECERMLKMPKESIWDSLAHVITHTLVEGYSNAKKCSAAGRALMQLDFAHFMSILELISNAKYPTHHNYVDAYIKAYYMPKDLLEEWIVDQKGKNNYSAKQFGTLITCTCVNDKKTRQKLMAIVGQQQSFDGNN